MFYLRNRALGGFIQNATASILLISSTYKSTIALAHCAQNSKLGKKAYICTSNCRVEVNEIMLKML